MKILTVKPGSKIQIPKKLTLIKPKVYSIFGMDCPSLSISHLLNPCITRGQSKTWPHCVSTVSLVNKIIYWMRKCVAAPSERWCRVMSTSHGEAIHLCIYGFYVLWPGQGKQIPLSQRCTLWTTGVMFPSRYPSFQTVKQHPSLNFGNKRFTASCSPFINLFKNLDCSFFLSYFLKIFEIIAWQKMESFLNS